MALKLAHLPVAKDLASFDFEAQPSVDPKQIRDLAAGRWIANGENLLLLRPPGGPASELEGSTQRIGDSRSCRPTSAASHHATLCAQLVDDLVQALDQVSHYVYR